MNGDGYAVRLTGGEDNQFGLAKSLSVMPGDTIKMEVFTKYISGTPANNSWASDLAGLMDAIYNNPAGVLVDGGMAGSIGGQIFPFAGFMTRNSETEGAPKAYLNWLVFNQADSLVDFGYVPVTTAALENGTNVAHEPLVKDDFLIREQGYVYIYLSNEDEGNFEVFFDDFKVIHVKSPVVQMDDYYPFGLTFNSRRRERALQQNYLYNGKEIQDELDLGIYNYGIRMYDPAIGRWSVPDPLAELGFSLTPFRYCFNNPVNYTDPLGLWEKDVNGNYATDDEEDINRFISYLTIESSMLNNNPSIDQINGFIAGEESDSGLGKLSDGSQLVSTVNVNGYQHGNRIDWYTDKKSFSNAWHEVQGSLTPDALDPRTIGQQPPFGLTYPGPNNPIKYNGKYDYTYVPKNLSEYPGIGHDRRYDNLGITGFWGLVSDTRAIGADWQFVSEEFMISSASSSTTVRMQSAFFGAVLGAGASIKTVMKLAKPQPAAAGAAFSEIMTWYSISNMGVSNIPDKPSE